MTIHPTAIVGEGAYVGQGATIGRYATVAFGAVVPCPEFLDALTAGVWA